MMKSTLKNSLMLPMVLLLVFAGRECHGSELRCYICDNCKTITKTTPTLECNADYFNTVGAVMPSTMIDNNSGMTEKAITVPTEGYMKTMMTTSTTKVNPANDQAIYTTTLKTATPSTTTTMPTTMATNTTEEESPKASTMMSTSTEMSPPTDVLMNTTTTHDTTTESTTMTANMGNTTHAIEGTPTTTTASSGNTLNEGLYQIGNTLLNNTMMTVMTDDNETDVMVPPIFAHVGSEVVDAASPPATSRAYMNSSTFRSRQARHVMPAKSESGAITYHCYTAQFVVNSTLNTRRGCARIKAMETVCGQLKQNNSPGTPINECRQCSADRCNGSNALSVSISVILMALVAVLIKQ